MKHLFISFLFIISISGVSSFAKDTPKTTANQNTCKVSGVVIDQNSGEALAGVKVIIEGNNNEAYTNFEGKFEFNNLLPGEYSLKCKLVTYEVYTIDNITINSENEEKVTLKLKPITEKVEIKSEVPAILFAINEG